VLLDAGEVDAVAAAVETCPSGALWYERRDGAPGEQPLEPTVVVPAENGPLVVMGDVRVETPGGDELSSEPRLTLCRCGATRNPPYCDNSHLARNFRSGPPTAKESGGGDVDVETGRATTIVPTEDGPLELHGCIEVLSPDGERLAAAEDMWLCRCGRSKTKPFCDGSHRNGFRSRSPEVPADREEADSPRAFAPNPHVGGPRA
jgi:CDGSH-type Zn-finger protein